MNHARLEYLQHFFAKETALLPCVKSSGDVINLHNVEVHHKTLFNYSICHWVFLEVIKFPHSFLYVLLFKPIFFSHHF